VHLSVLRPSEAVVSQLFVLLTRPDVYNKIDAISLEQVDKLARQDHTVVISAEQDLK
jgi:ribosome-interacting GTPase 1